jgi:putative peptidoglycan lipid II flippase
LSEDTTATIVIEQVLPSDRNVEEAPSLAKASGSMAIATLFSRISGFVSKLLIAWLIGFSVVNDSYTIANTLPNIVFELLIGGVLTSVVVPLLVRAQDDPDGGILYTQKLLTVGLVVLAGGTAVAIAAAPLIVRMFIDSSAGQSNPALATAFAYLLLPEIFFYGLGALLGAILNAKHVFGPPAWAPVLNNVVVIATAAVYYFAPGTISLNPVRMGDAKLLILGLGTTLGIVVQALVLVPPLLRLGFPLRWRWGWDSRLSEFGGLALWVLGYVAVSQVGYVVVNRVATAGEPGGVAIYSYSWLLLQVPYGVLGVSLLTAIMPRMSRAAADGDTQGVIDHLAHGSRLTAVMLVPISALMTVLGPSLGDALFSMGKGGGDAGRLGLALTASAFGLLPYSVTLLQLRVFYALKDARTPTLIMLIMIVVKVPLSYLCPTLLSPDTIVFGLVFVNSLSFVVGVVVGEMWLRARLGRTGTRGVLVATGKTLVASVWGAAAALVISQLADRVLPHSPAANAWLSLLVGGVLGMGCAFGVMAMLGVDELRPVMSRITQLAARR